MKSEKKDLDKIFEKSLKWRLLKKSFTSVEAVRVLINNFRNYDLTNTGKINRDKWVSCLYSDGLTIGISKEDLGKLFDKYKDENSETCDYKKFAFDIFFKHKNNMSLNKVNPNGNNIMDLNDSNDSNDNSKINNNINYKQIQNTNINYNQTESSPLNNLRYNNNNPSIAQNQKYLNTNNNALNNSMPFINTNKNIDINDINDDKYYRHYYIRSRGKNNNLDMDTSNIYYSGFHVNSLNYAVNYFHSRIHVNNGLTYYRFISELKSKCANDDKILKSNLSLILQDVGIFYTQNELENLFDSLGCSEITVNDFSLSKIIELLKDEMNDNRKKIITNAFNYLCQTENNNNNTISVNTLKEKFNANMHPSVLNGARNAKDIYDEFCQTLDIFVNLNNGKNNFNLGDFIEFYSGVSPSIIDDSYFENIIKNVWLVNNNNDNIITSSTNTDNSNINNYNKYKNFSMRDRVNNKSHVRMNLPLFYYNINSDNNFDKYDKFHGLSKSINFKGNNNYNQNMNNVFTPSSRSRYQF